MRNSVDDRRIAYCDIFGEIDKGDLNVSIIYPSSKLCWHLHEKQSDYQFVVNGSLKIGICNAPFDSWKVNDWSKHELGAKYTRNKLMETWEKKYKQICSDDIDSMLGKNFVSDDYLLDLKKTFCENSYSPACKWIVLSDRSASNGPTYIPPGLWHGSYNFTNENATLIYHITNKWDGTDEYRQSEEMMNWKWEREVK